MTTRGGGTSSRRSQRRSTSTRRVRARPILRTPTWSLTLSVCAALLASRLTPALSTIPSFHLSMSPEKRAEHAAAAAAAAAGAAVESPARPVGVHAPPKSTPTLSPEKKRDRDGGAIKFTDQTAQFGSPKQPTPSPARATPTPSPAAAKEARPLQPQPQAQAQSPRPQSEGTKAVAAILHAGSDAKRAVVIDDDDV